MSPSKTPELQAASTVVVGDFEGSWADLLASAKKSTAAGLLKQPSRIAVVVDGDLQALQLLSLCSVSRTADVLVLPDSRLTEGVIATIASHGFALTKFDGSMLREPSATLPVRGGSITLLTSGSTGTPKLVAHTFDTLFTAARARKIEPSVWLVPYQTGTYAWFQLVTKGMFSPNQKLVFSTSHEPSIVFAVAAQHSVTSISATPTFWRLAMLQMDPDALTAVPLRQIALGGEASDQSILDHLAALYPSADISHVYASTEVGTCIVVKDRKAGFPATILDRRDGLSPELRVCEGRLEVRSPFAACGGITAAEAGWIDTGDVVEFRGDRVHFCGRADTAMINVGGNKAFPADIEAVIQKHPSVAWSRVRARKAPLVGHLAEADVVLRPGSSAVDEANLTQHCAAKVPEYAVPRFWNFLSAIPVQGSLKSSL
jgi:acyl-CoA synthetase (AMP-forming)/AMP-acid ligase II